MIRFLILEEASILPVKLFVHLGRKHEALHDKVCFWQQICINKDSSFSLRNGVGLSFRELGAGFIHNAVKSEFINPPINNGAPEVFFKVRHTCNFQNVLDHRSRLRRGHLYHLKCRFIEINLLP